VLLDAHMPGTDGFELARHIRARPDAAGLKILMLTSGGQPGDAARTQELGFSAYLTKPIKQADLWRALIRALDSTPAPGPPARALTPRRAHTSPCGAAGAGPAAAPHTPGRRQPDEPEAGGPAAREAGAHGRR